MKTKYWTINEAGNVKSVHPMQRRMDVIEIEAVNKTEAASLLLRRLAQIAKLGTPKVVFNGNAYALCYPSVTHPEGWEVEGGTIHPGRKASDGTQLSLVMAYAKTLADVPKAASLEWYGSTEFQAEESKRFTPLCPG